MASCPSCGTVLSDGAGYCYGCGAHLEGSGGAGVGSAPPQLGGSPQWSPQPGAPQPAGPPAPVPLPGWPQPAGQAAPAAAPSSTWQPLPGKVSHVTVMMAVTCDHCARPVPLNGPTRVAHCENCYKDTPLRRVPEELALAAEGMQRMGSPYTSRTSSTPDPVCSQCGEGVDVAQYLSHVGATTTIPCPKCGTGLPTFPAPAWLKVELPMAQQVFGGDLEVAREEGGLAVAIDQGNEQPIAMACPSCGGGLTITAESERTTACQYCQASVFLPDELWKRLHPVKTMERWTLTYTDTLKTAEDLQEEQQEEQQERQQRQQRHAHVAQVTAKAQRSGKRGKVISFLGAGVGIVVAVVAVAFGAVGGSCSSVEGKFVAKGDPLTKFTMRPTECRSGQRKNFFGVMLLSEKKKNQAIKILEDPTKGMVVQVQIPSSCKNNRCKFVTFGEDACDTFDLEVNRTSTSVNDIRLLEGHLKLKCKFDEGGTAKASLKFSRCD
jgi:hypothetical protein